MVKLHRQSKGFWPPKDRSWRLNHEIGKWITCWWLKEVCPALPIPAPTVRLFRGDASLCTVVVCLLRCGKDPACSRAAGSQHECCKWYITEAISEISPLFQSKAKCEAFHMETSFIHSQMLVHLHVNKTNFHMKGFTLGLALKQRRKATRKSPNAIVWSVSRIVSKIKGYK